MTLAEGGKMTETRLRDWCTACGWHKLIETTRREGKREVKLCVDCVKFPHEVEGLLRSFFGDEPRPTGADPSVLDFPPQRTLFQSRGETPRNGDHGPLEKRETLREAEFARGARYGFLWGFLTGLMLGLMVLYAFFAMVVLPGVLP